MSVLSPSRAALPGSPFVAYQGGQLMIEQVALRDLATQHGTPLFVYSQASILAALAAYQRGTALLHQCQEILGKAEQTIRVLESTDTEAPPA